MVLIFCHVLVQPVAGRGAARGGCTHKVDTDGGDVALCVCVVGESKQQARLSDTRVTDEEELEEVVVSGERPVSGDDDRGRRWWQGATARRQRWVHAGRELCGIVVSTATGVDLAWRAPPGCGGGRCAEVYVLLGIHFGGRVGGAGRKGRGIWNKCRRRGKARVVGYRRVGHWQAVSSTKVGRAVTCNTGCAWRGRAL